MKIILTFVIAVIFISCNSQPENNIETINIELSKADLTKKRNDIFSFEKLIELDSSNIAIIGRANKVAKSNDRYFIMDRKQHMVFQFNQNGKFISKLHKYGKGPEEYIYLGDMHVNEKNKTYNILDAKKDRIYTYSFNNEYISSVSIKKVPLNSLHYMEMLSKDTVALTTFLDEKRVVVYDLKHQKVLCEKAKSKVIKLPIHGSITPFFWLNEKLCYYELWDKTIYEVTAKKIAPLYKIEFDRDFIDLTNTEKGNIVQSAVHVMYNNDWISGLQSIRAIGEKMIIEFAYKDENYTAIFNTKSKKLNLYRFDDFKKFTASIRFNYNTYNDKILFSIKSGYMQKNVLDYIQESMGGEPKEKRDNPYLLELCLKK